MVLGTVRREAGPSERRPKALKTKIVKGGPSGLSPLRSDGSHDVGGLHLLIANIIGGGPPFPFREWRRGATARDGCQGGN